MSRSTSFFAVLLAASSALAQAEAIPVLVNHQGLLLGANDEPVEGAQTLTFRLYELGQKPIGSDDVPVWFETYSSTMHRGYYSVTLGATEGGRKQLTSAHLPPGASRFLAVEIPGYGELSPRIRVSIVPYALNAAFAQKAISADQATHADDADRAADATKIGGKTWAERLTELDGRFAPVEGAVKLQGGVATAQTGGLAVTGTVEAGTLDADSVTAGSLVASGNVQAGSFSGGGASITGLNASALASGTVPSDRLSGAYGQVLSLQNNSNSFRGTFEGTHTGTFSGTFSGAFSGSTLTVPAADSAPTCGDAERGRIYFNRTDGQVYVCNGGWKPTAQLVKLEWREVGVFDQTHAPRLVVEVKNAGDQEARGLAVTATGAFTVTGDCGTTLAAGATCRATVVLASGQPADTAIAGTLTARADGASTLSRALASRVGVRDTCWGHKVGGATTDTNYWIDPDGLGGAAPFSVYCDQTTDSGGWTLAAYCGAGDQDIANSKGLNIRDLKCGGGTYNPGVRTGCATLPSVALARRSRSIAFTRSDAVNRTGNMDQYTTIARFNLPDPANVTFDNHAALAPYVGDAIDRGPCVGVTLVVLKPTGVARQTRYTHAKSLGTSWHGDSFPTGYGAVDSPGCESAEATKGPFFASVHSGSGRRHTANTWAAYDNACVTDGRGDYQWRGHWDHDVQNKTGAVAIWFK